MKAFLDYLNTHTEKPFRVTKFELRKVTDTFAIFVRSKQQFIVLQNMSYGNNNIGWRSGNENFSGSVLYFLDKMYIDGAFNNWRFV